MGRERVGFGEGFVFLVGRGGIGGRDRIVSLFARTKIIRIFADDGGVFALLTSRMLDLDDAGEVFVVGLLHLHGRLEEARWAFEG